jgi:hypothetical protein
MARSPERREGCAQALTEIGPMKECRTRRLLPSSAWLRGELAEP